MAPVLIPVQIVMSRIVLILTAAAALPLLSSCGLKGPLYLPAPPGEETPQDPAGQPQTLPVSAEQAAEEQAAAEQLQTVQVRAG